MPSTPEAIALAQTACAAADDKLATNPVILDVAELLGLVEIFVIVTAGNERQLKAIADNIEDKIREDQDRRPLRREGTTSSGWYLLDFGDVVCHVFDEEQRGFFDLDRLWGDAAAIDPISGEVVRPALVTKP